MHTPLLTLHASCLHAKVSCQPEYMPAHGGNTTCGYELEWTLFPMHASHLGLAQLPFS